MLKSVEGVYRDGEVKLLEPVPKGAQGKVIVTFLESRDADLASRVIDDEQAADLRQRLGTFAEDWDRPEMDVYDGSPEPSNEPPTQSSTEPSPLTASRCD